jgi:protein-disulfide isomerase
MSKRQELRDRRRKAQARSRIIVIALVVVGAAFVTFALVLPGINISRNAAATQTVLNGNPVLVTPRAFKAKVDGVHLGDPNAPVKVVAYEDFRCSSCLSYTENIEPAVIQNYIDTGKVYYTYGFLLVIDSNDGADASRRAANAALCAAAQNKFWPYHDTLYANQITESADWFSDARLAKMAQNVGLDMSAFNQCYQSKQYDADVIKSENEAIALKASGTPSIVVDGVLIPNYNTVTTEIDKALAGK